MPMSCRISGSRIGDAAQSGAEMAWTRKLRRLGVEPVPEAELPTESNMPHLIIDETIGRAGDIRNLGLEHLRAPEERDQHQQ